MSIIEIRKLTFSYSNSGNVLDGISVDIEEGEFVGIMGETGSGKSTFALCLNGLIPNSVEGSFSGCVSICGKLTSETPVAELAPTVGLVFQDPDAQIFSLTVEDEVAFGPENIGLSKENVKKRINYALNAAGIEDLRKRETHALSQGQKQKVCIASVLAMDPKVIVLDEPTASLDHKSTLDIYNLLSNLNKQGKTIIVVEHKAEMLSKFARRVLVMNKSSFALDESPAKTFRKKAYLESLGIVVPQSIALESKIIRLEKELAKLKSGP